MDSKNKTGLKYRLLASTLFFAFVLVNTFFELGVTQVEPTGIEDKFHKSLSSINNFFKNHSNFKNTLIIISNAILDLSAVFFAIIWLAFAKNLRPFFSLLVFFAIKIATQILFEVRPPQDNLIEFPGFPSLLYSYNVNNYFFFSGTTGFTFIMIYEFFKNSESVKFSKAFGFLNLANLFFFSFLSLCFYSLYTVDVLIGVLTAHYAIRLAHFLHPVFDGKFFAAADAAAEAENNNNNSNNNCLVEKDYFESLFSFLIIESEKDFGESAEKQKITTEENLKDVKEPNYRSDKGSDSFDVKTSNQVLREKDIVYNDECDI
jgi:hypothetical protein